MADEDLRRLRRAALSPGATTHDRLAYIRANERMGRCPACLDGVDGPVMEHVAKCPELRQRGILPHSHTGTWRQRIRRYMHTLLDRMPSWIREADEHERRRWLNDNAPTAIDTDSTSPNYTLYPCKVWREELRVALRGNLPAHSRRVSPSPMLPDPRQADLFGGA